MKAFFSDLAGNLRQGGRIMLARRLSLDDLRISPDQLVALVLLGLVARFAIGVAFNGPHGLLNPYALAAELAVIGMTLFCAFVIARLTGEPRLLPGFAIAVLAVDFWFLALQWPARWAEGNLPWFSPPLAQGLHLALVAWFIVAAFVAVLRLTAGRAARGTAGYAVFLFLYLGSYWMLPPQDIWMARPAPPEPAEWRMTVADEEVLHAQPALLDAALAALRPERRGVPDIYVVGFAGYSREDVFMKEIETVAGVLRERFDTDGRTVALINNPRTAGTVPSATATSLGRVLRHLGGIMNREEDVLLLYLASHGSERHRLSVVNGPLTLREIDPPLLARMLEESGIKWRVLAVSACYSGGFVDALRNDWTLVMTAADAASQSFGCGAESELTYFGKALFDEALRETHSLTEAFARARVAIAAREREGKHRPSNPQIVVGAAMAGKLREIESRLGLLPPPPGAAIEEDR